MQRCQNGVRPKLLRARPRDLGTPQGPLIHRAAEILAPLYDRMLARIVANAHCQADETSFRLQNRPDKRGFVWTFLASKLVAYVFSGDRS
ncbi:MAG TPA: transposase [Polyangiaceae bacterium]|nr:transposase [Polyangiaceae bacterium]